MDRGKIDSSLLISGLHLSGFWPTNRFEIYHYGLGPTEFRIGLLIINTIIIVLGVEHFKYTLPLVCIVLATLLVVYCYETQKKIWAIDKG